MTSTPKMTFLDDRAILPYKAIINPMLVNKAEDEKGFSGYGYSTANERQFPVTEHMFPANVLVGNTGKMTIELNDRLFVKDEYQYVRILLSEIDFVKSNGNYIEIHSHGKKRLIKKALKDIELKLDASFFQVHRSYLVNIRKIERVGGNSLWIGQTEIPVIKQQREQLLLLFNVLS